MSEIRQFRGFGLGVGARIRRQLAKWSISASWLARLGLADDDLGRLLPPDERLHRACRLSHQSGDDKEFLRSLKLLSKGYPHRTSYILKWARVCVDRSDDPRFEEVARFCIEALGEGSQTGRQLLKSLNAHPSAREEHSRESHANVEAARLICRSCERALERMDGAAFLDGVGELCECYPEARSDLLRLRKRAEDATGLDADIKSAVDLIESTLGLVRTPGEISSAQSRKSEQRESRPNRTAQNDLAGFLSGRQEHIRSETWGTFLEELAVFENAALQADDAIISYHGFLLGTTGDDFSWISAHAEGASVQKISETEVSVLVEEITTSIGNNLRSGLSCVLADMKSGEFGASLSSNVDAIGRACGRILKQFELSGSARELEAVVRLTGGVLGGSEGGRDVLAARVIPAVSSMTRLALFNICASFARFAGEAVFSPVAQLSLLNAVRDWQKQDCTLLHVFMFSELELPQALIMQLGNSQGFMDALQELYHLSTASDLPEGLLELSGAIVEHPGVEESQKALCRIVMLLECGDPSILEHIRANPREALPLDFVDVLLNKLAEYQGSAEFVRRLVPPLAEVTKDFPARAAAVASCLARLGMHAAFNDFARRLADSHTQWQPVAAVSAAKLRGHDKGKGDRPVIVLTDMNLSRLAFDRLGLPAGSHIYHVNGTIPEPGPGGDVLHFAYGRKVNDDQAFMRDLTAQSEQIADILVKRFTALVTSPGLRYALEDISAALFATVRARLIGVFRQDAIQRCWLERVGSDGARLILLMEKPAALESALGVVNSLPDGDGIGVELRLFPDSPKSAERLLGALETAKDRSSDKIEVSDLLPLKHDGLETLLVRLLSQQSPVFAKVRTDQPVTLFVNRMSAKTVPGTLIPVMQRALEDGDIHLLDIQTSGDAPCPPQFASDKPFRLHYASTSVMQKKARRDTSVDTDVISVWFRSLFSRIGDQYLPETWKHCRSAIVQNGLGFDARTFAYLFSLRATFESLFEGRRDATVYVSPGRSAEAYCAQHMAGRRGLLSIEVVNAWLSEQYTYARPRGDIVTALDHWTADLLKKHFGIPKKNIRTVGTPRFDGVYSRASQMDKPESRKLLGFTNDLPTICVALQPIDLEINAQILKGVFCALKKGAVANVLIKPHPREESQRLQAYELMAREHMPEDSGECLVVPKADIIAALVASDVCVTAFSNVGVEAALCQLDTLLCQFDGMDAPVRLDEMGLGLASESPEVLSDQLVSVLSGGKELDEIRRRRQFFFDNNKHYLEGSAAQDIYGLRGETKLAGSALERPLIL